ncbi:ADP-ribose diphosphatase [Aliivibrio sp. 1S165]|uniref:ADP-ribose diphosphatase n=1 Tax=unclassified Aliivibrio TaxID=2645654 RepID=UPI00080EA191|nr:MULTISPECIES: ADP-ribose diphosphatase [unclassified Aliivibrio]OCH18519.1 ADP-ribose diphosphatase [Aliivibrio sp. 1S165]OCH34909.1 ADP-ribose diphosphatase [Aliivibrio sp. 1S175]
MGSSSNRQLKNQFTRDDVDILSKQSLYNGFFNMTKITFRHKLFNGGWSEYIDRELFERGHAVALLPYDPITDKVILIEQVRVGALESDNPWQYEIVAGMIDKDQTSEQVAIREADEEAGIKVSNLEKISNFYPSSGGCTEQLDVFIGCTDASKATGIHGLDDENEDIRVHVFTREEAYALVTSGIIENAASIIALQWLELNISRLRSQWNM